MNMSGVVLQLSEGGEPDKVELSISIFASAYRVHMRSVERAETRWRGWERLRAQ